MRCMGYQGLLEIFEKRPKGLSRRHDLAFRQHFAQEETNYFGEINHRNVLIKYMNDVYERRYSDGATRFGALMFPRNIALGWEPSLAVSLYRLRKRNNNGYYEDCTAYLSGPAVINPPYLRHVDSGTRINFSASELLK